MGLAHRVIPTILCRGRSMVKGKRFDSWRSVGVAAQAVRIHQARGVDEVCLLDIGATLEGRGPDLSLVEELSDVLFAPLAVGGGIRSVQDVRALLNAGADKVVIGTGAMPRFLREVSDVVGTQAIVVAIDADDRGRAYARCGTEALDLEAGALAAMAQASGAGELLITSIPREGTLEGYDLGLIATIARLVDVPVIAHGGCSGYADMKAAIEAGASAVAAGALFQFTDATPKDAARYLQSKGIEARV